MFQVKVSLESFALPTKFFLMLDAAYRCYEANKGSANVMLLDSQGNLIEGHKSF